jgi:hypothetical protein
MYIPLFVLTYACAVALSWLAWRRFAPLRTVTGCLCAAALFFVLAVAAVLRSPPEFLTLGGFAVAPAVLLLVPFLVRAVEVWVDAIRNAAQGLDGMKAVRTYDLAEKAAVERRDDEAIRLYREVYLAKDPADPVPRLRIADLLLRNGRKAEAAGELRAALPHIADVDEMLVAAFRAADLEPAGAAAWLASLRPRVADPKKQALLEARISRAERSER